MTHSPSCDICGEQGAETQWESRGHRFDVHTGCVSGAESAFAAFLAATFPYTREAREGRGNAEVELK